jgi:ankyrin repeat protein
MWRAVVRLLLANGADLDIPRNNGDTALTLAAFNSREAVVRPFLANQANPNWTNVKGHTPLLATTSAVTKRLWALHSGIAQMLTFETSLGPVRRKLRRFAVVIR